MDFSIGELARRTGVKVPTIRYYEQIGLLPSPPRTEGQQRRYNIGHTARLNFVRHARELGFEVDAVRELLAMNAKPDQSCANVDEMARRHIAGIDRRIAHLSTLRAELQRTVDECGRGRVCECRVIETLADGSHDLGEQPGSSSDGREFRTNRDAGQSPCEEQQHLTGMTRQPSF